MQTELLSFRVLGYLGLGFRGVWFGASGFE